jgi:hypothetical protein
VACRDLVDLRPIGDVADGVLRAELAGERLQPLLAARQQQAPPAARGEAADDRLAEPARRAGDDG